MNQPGTTLVERCPVCQDAGSSFWRTGRDRRYGAVEGEFVFVRCRACGVVYLQTAPTAALLDLLYAEDYEPYRDDGADDPIADLARMAADARYPWARPVAEVYRCGGGPCRLLDYGCGSPAFLRAAAAHGWSVLGADFTAASVARIADSGFEAYTVDQLWDRVAPGEVDVIRMNHVLEHLPDPVETLRRLKPLLRDDGRFHIAVPNAASWASTVFRSYWTALEPRHLLQLTPDTLRATVTRAGLDVLHLAHQPKPEHAVRSLAAFVNRNVPGRIALRASGLLARPAARICRGDVLHVIAR